MPGKFSRELKIIWQRGRATTLLKCWRKSVDEHQVCCLPSARPHLHCRRQRDRKNQTHSKQKNTQTKSQAQWYIVWITAIDDQLRKKQTEFRKGRGCIDQIFTLHNITEQCAEWQRRICLNFVDFKKAFDSIHRESLWQILRAYGIPNEMFLLIKSFYNNFACQVGESHINFAVTTGVRQGCMMSAVLFNLVMDWVMRKTTKDQARGIRWIPS